MTTTYTVAVITYRRPVDLARLLPGLREQVAELNARSEPSYDGRILVVDNDPAGSGSPVVAAYDDVAYVREPEPGIAAARNRSIAETGERDLLVFIDDDEVPRAGWLAALLDMHHRTHAEAVTGSVVSTFDAPVNEWITAGEFFTRRHRQGLAAGTELAVAASNNLLLDRRALDRFGIRFDADFGLSGGSDTLFSRELVSRGGRIVWCPDACVVEHVPAARLSRRWLLTRALSYGTTDCRVAIRLADGRGPRLQARARCVGRGIPRVLVGAVRQAYGRLTGSPRHQALGAQTLWRGSGLVLGSFGYSYQRYRR
ncbi:glycosyltransferase family 2 protein [uncultured Jatrophihabitans sp.]|uniref:glycosyltransferase family 2 protein n=1 Tax=uncultured Jatrophihabitans sp. TaxID=1610747 RepID=UPI0035CBD10D